MCWCLSIIELKKMHGETLKYTFRHLTTVENEASYRSQKLQQQFRL